MKFPTRKHKPVWSARSAVRGGLSLHPVGTSRIIEIRWTTLREKLINIGAKVVTHARYVIFQMAEVAVPRKLFCEILRRIHRLREPVPG